MSMTLRKAALEVGREQDKMYRARQLIELIGQAAIGMGAEGEAIANASVMAHEILIGSRHALDELRAKMVKAESKEVQS